MHTKNEQLIDKLIDKSESGDITWSKADLPNQYSLHLSDKIITISRNTSMGTTRVRFEIKEKDGSVIDSLSKIVGTPGSSDAELLADLYEAARRNANRINETIDDLLAELD